MKELISTIVKGLGSNLGKVILSVCAVAKAFFSYKEKQQDVKIQKKEEKEKKQIDKKINEVVDNGTLDDLLKIFAISLCVVIVGCKTTEVNVTTTNCWEGHYMTVDDFKQKTHDISLKEDESIWVLSNSTLKNILKESIK